MWDWCGPRIRTSARTPRTTRRAPATGRTPAHRGGRHGRTSRRRDRFAPGRRDGQVAIPRSETDDIPSALRDSLIRANARIFSEAQSNPDLRGMGTTTSVLAVREQRGMARARRRLAHLSRARRRDQAAHRRSLARRVDGARGTAHFRGSGDASAAQRPAALDGCCRGSRDRRPRTDRASRRRYVHPLQRRPARRRQRRRDEGDRGDADRRGGGRVPAPRARAWRAGQRHGDRRPRRAGPG